MAEVNPNDFIRISNAQLRYYFKIPNPDNLSDKEWAMRVKDLEYVRKLENNQKN